jgi:SnoaL-like domain
VLGGRFKGRDSIRAWLQRWFNRMPAIRFTLRHVSVENIFAVGASNVVHVEWELDETDQEGRSYYLTGVTAFEVVGGKAKRVKDYIFDQNTIAQIWPSKDAAQPLTRAPHLSPKQELRE